MKTKILTSIGCLLLMAALVRADALLSFDDHGQGGLTASSGSYTPGSTFTFDITLAVTNSGTDPVPNVNSISYWFETSAVNNSYFTIVSRNLSGSPFTDPQATISNEAVVQGGNASDLGATTPPNTSVASNNSYFVATLTLKINPGTPNGTYTISTTTLASNGGPKTSTVGDTNFQRHNLPAATYTITVVPEPATLSLLGLSGLGSLGLTYLRRNRRS